MRFPESSLKTLNRWTSSSACIWTVQMLCITQNQEPELGEDSQNPRYRPVQKTATSDQSPEGICSVCEQIVLKSDYTSQQSHLMNASSDCVGKWTLEIMVSKSITLPKQTTSDTQAHFPCWFLSSDKNQGFSQLAVFFAAFTETYSYKHRLKGCHANSVLNEGNQMTDGDSPSNWTL